MTCKKSLSLTYAINFPPAGDLSHWHTLIWAANFSARVNPGRKVQDDVQDLASMGSYKQGICKQDRQDTLALFQENVPLGLTHSAIAGRRRHDI